LIFYLKVVFEFKLCLKSPYEKTDQAETAHTYLLIHLTILSLTPNCQLLIRAIIHTY